MIVPIDVPFDGKALIIVAVVVNGGYAHHCFTLDGLTREKVPPDSWEESNLTTLESFFTGTPWVYPFDNPHSLNARSDLRGFLDDDIVLGTLLSKSSDPEELEALVQVYGLLCIRQD